MNFLKDFQTEWRLFAIVGIIALVLGGVIIISLQSLTPPITQQTSSDEEKKLDETEDWKIYRNANYGFEVEYPGKDWFWDVEESGVTLVIFCSKDFYGYYYNQGVHCKPEGTASEVILVIAEKDTKNPENNQISLKYYGCKAIESRSISIAGKEGELKECVIEGERGNSLFALWGDGSDIYRLKTENLGMFPGDRAIFDHMLSAFHQNEQYRME